MTKVEDYDMKSAYFTKKSVYLLDYYWLLYIVSESEKTIASTVCSWLYLIRPTSNDAGLYFKKPWGYVFSLFSQPVSLR